MWREHHSSDESWVVDKQVVRYGNLGYNLPKLGKKEPSMELQTIADRTQLPLRKLRYVLDHRLLPGLRVKIDGNEVGRPRYFTDYEAFGVACAAALLGGGVKREAVIHFMNAMTKLTWEGAPYAKQPGSSHLERVKKLEKVAFYTAYSKTGAAIAMLGDGVNIRVYGKGGDTGWRQPQTLARLNEEYRPLIVVQLDLARLREQLKKIPTDHG